MKLWLFRCSLDVTEKVDETPHNVPRPRTHCLMHRTESYHGTRTTVPAWLDHCHAHATPPMGVVPWTPDYTRQHTGTRTQMIT